MGSKANSISLDRIKDRIRTVPNWPIKGIQFRDITPLLQDPECFGDVCNLFISRYSAMNLTQIVAIDARGFILAGVIAYILGVGLIPVRKKGKLPYSTYEKHYSLEYGQATLAVHKDALYSKDRVVIVDDLLATGGTAKAAVDLVNKFGCNLIEVGVLIELPDLGGREVLEVSGTKLFSLLTFEGE